MKDTSIPASRRTITGIFLFLIVMMITGSFFDYPLSCFLYNESLPAAVFFAAYGEYPAAFGLAAAGAMLFAGRNRKHRIIGILQCIGGIVLILLGGLAACAMPNLYLSAPVAVVVAIGLLVTAAVVFSIFRLCRNAERKTIIQVMLVFFLVIMAEMLLINIIKIPWGRPRMRLLAVNSAAVFTPWWQAGSSLKTALMAAGVAGEEFKSFPSGHTGNAVTMMLLSLLPLLNPKIMKWQKHLFWFGFAWACVVAITRIIMGAHYLTDTVAGFAVSFAALCVVCRLLLRKDISSIQYIVN